MDIKSMLVCWQNRFQIKNGEKHCKIFAKTFSVVSRKLIQSSFASFVFEILDF